ncbi:N-6 DNA methylase [Fructilactobacillus hinvesii]|uniref:N-6 DNA methylase n=1 Tax=Fructilactobacillus hinvesii TaxID=2940300 RepID=UPI0020935BA7|nr:N-6 DNA methylase [Fructilactobacillus hinvesii]
MDNEQINQLIGVEEDYKAPDQLMKIIMDPQRRENMFQEFLKIDDDLSQDHFRSYFQQQMADRGRNKQDFTPNSLTKLTALIVGNGMKTLDDCCGTGGLTIAKWWNDVQSGNYNSNFHYTMIEKTTAALPFLLFNMMIRNMNATVISGDVLTQKINHVYEIEASDQFSQMKKGAEQLSLV